MLREKTRLENKVIYVPGFLLRLLNIPISAANFDSLGCSPKQFTFWLI